MCRVSEPCCPVPKSERLLGTTLDSLVLGPNSTASFKQETAAPTKEMGGMASAPGTKFTILWQQGWSEQKNALPRNYGSSQDLQSLIIVVSVY